MNNFLDIFQHKGEKEKEYVQEYIKNIHSNFKNHVIKYRKDKLIKDDIKLDKIYNADVYNGEDAMQLGLIDGIGNYRTILNEKYPKLQVKDYTSHKEIVVREILLKNSTQFVETLANKIIFKH